MPIPVAVISILVNERMKAFAKALLLFTLISCSDKLENKELYGQYVFSRWNKDTLELRTNGTYYYRTYLGHRKLENLRSWKLNASGNEIEFKIFSYLTDRLSKASWYARLRTEGK